MFINHFLLGALILSDAIISLDFLSSCILYSTTKNSPLIIFTVAGHQPLGSSLFLPSDNTSQSSPAFNSTGVVPDKERRLSAYGKRIGLELFVSNRTKTPSLSKSNKIAYNILYIKT
jgi:hypothetical protein